MAGSAFTGSTAAGADLGGATVSSSYLRGGEYPYKQESLERVTWGWLHEYLQVVEEIFIQFIIFSHDDSVAASKRARSVEGVGSIAQI